MIRWFPYVFIVLTALVLLVFFYEQNKFHRWIFTYWGKKPTIFRRFQLLTYIVATLLFLGSLADWRGDEKTLEGKKVSEKTILLIDNSLSMLAEDVRPNRFEKAILMARHFVKASPGHEISVILFSDINRKYVPFTTDIDLLDARITGLKELSKNIGGSSNIKQAIREALDNLDPNPLARKGNIVVFSDADGMDEDFPLEIGSNVAVAMVAIGTASGAPIPVRGRDGVLQGYKTYKGQQVTSKINQSFLDSLMKQIKNYKYWVVTSFSLPTNEILQFLQNKSVDAQGNNQNMRSREVLYEWWLVPAIFIMMFSLFLKRVKTWTINIAFIAIFLGGLVFFSNTTVQAQDNKVKEIIPLMDALKNNQLDEKGRMSIAQKLLEAGEVKKALKIYQETLDAKDVTESNKHSWINYAQALSANKKSADAIRKMQKLQVYQDEQVKKNKTIDSTFEKQFSESLLSMLQSQEQEQKEQKEKEKQKQQEKDQQKNDEQKSDQQKNDEQDKKNQSGDDKNDQRKSDQNKEDDKNEGQKNQQDQEDKQKPADQPKSRSERQKELSSLLKQLLNEDRSLQQKIMETTTKDPSQRNNGSDGAKDW